MPTVADAARGRGVTERSTNSGRFPRRALLRMLYSLAMSAGIASAVIAVLVGGVCKPTDMFDFYGSLAAPRRFFTEGYFVAYPVWLLIALAALPFTPSTCWSRRGVSVLVLVPVAIYAVFGGLLALVLYLSPVSGCF